MLLTLINLLNYMVGKPLSIYVLILATIAIYYYLINNFYSTFGENKFYMVLLILIVIIDITIIIIIFSTSHKYDPKNVVQTLKIKHKKHKSKYLKDNDKIPNKKIDQITNDNQKLIPNKSESKSNNNNPTPELIPEANPNPKSDPNLDSQNINLPKEVQSILSLYDNKSETSLKTY